MKKILGILADQIWTLVSLALAWIVFEGSARTFATYLILLGTAINVIREYTKEEK